MHQFHVFHGEIGVARICVMRGAHTVYWIINAVLLRSVVWSRVNGSARPMHFGSDCVRISLITANIRAVKIAGDRPRRNSRLRHESAWELWQRQVTDVRFLWLNRAEQCSKNRTAQFVAWFIWLAIWYGNRRHRIYCIFFQVLSQDSINSFVIYECEGAL
jgi:hypothetical protein